jgi:hypothetical protein
MGANESYNWSGARIRKEVLPPLGKGDNFFTSVKATWTVPKVTLRGSEKNARSAAWIGLDGGTWGLPDTPREVKVLQAGTYHEVVEGGSPTYIAFFGLDKGDAYATDIYKSRDFQKFQVRAGDKITVVLNYDQSRGSATADFTGSSIASLPPQPMSLPIVRGMITGYTVEWIFERISKDNNSHKPVYEGSYYPLGKNDDVDFTDAVAFTDQGNQVSPDQGDSISMFDPKQLTDAAALPSGVKIKQHQH